MNAYQQKWLDILQNAKLKGWEIKAVGNDIYIDMPSVKDLKVIRDNLPITLASLSLDIDLRPERVKFIFYNGYENFEYILNPDAVDLNKG
jgi:hypothetical protein